MLTPVQESDLFGYLPIL